METDITKNAEFSIGLDGFGYNFMKKNLRDF